MKNKFTKKLVVAGLSVALLGGIGLNSTTVLGLPGTAAIVAHAEGVKKQVTNFKEFESALKDASVAEISVAGDIEFTKKIDNVPARDLTINGNKDQGFTINIKDFSINGQQGTLAASNEGKNNVFSIVNANIVGNLAKSSFFIGGSGTGTSSFGWDVLAKDVTYEGSRFVNLSEGKLSFDGVNEINTRLENAWVHDLEFLPNSEYKGQAAMKDGSPSAGFSFNGRLIDSKIAGKVDIASSAKVDMVLSPQGDRNFQYPVFFGNVYQVNVKEGAEFNVDAAGTAFQFSKSDDQKKIEFKNVPSLNLGENASVRFTGRGGSKAATVKLQEMGVQINQDNDSVLKIYGNSETGVIDSTYALSSFNMNNAANLDIANRKENSPLFKGERTFVKAYNEEKILTWNQTGGNYPVSDISNNFNSSNYFQTYIGLNNKYETASSAEVFTNDDELKTGFVANEYGRILFVGASGEASEAK